MYSGRDMYAGCERLAGSQEEVRETLEKSQREAREKPGRIQREARKKPAKRAGQFYAVLKCGQEAAVP